MDYYASYKNSKDPSLLRKELVSYAISYGNKKTAQQFQNTVKTVRKWRKRREEKKGRDSKTCLENLKKSLHDETVLAIQNQKYRGKSGGR